MSDDSYTSSPFGAFMDVLSVPFRGVDRVSLRGGVMVRLSLLPSELLPRELVRLPAGKRGISLQDMPQLAPYPIKGLV